MNILNYNNKRDRIIFLYEDRIYVIDLYTLKFNVYTKDAFFLNYDINKRYFPIFRSEIDL